MKNRGRILVIKLGALGDFIQALGPMAAIRAHHPKAHITLMTTAPFEKFARICPYVDEIIIDKKPKLLNILGWASLKKKLNEGNYTRVYDLQNNNRTSCYFQLFEKKSRPEWVGIAAGASHRNTSPERTQGHAFEGHVQTLGRAGIKNVNIDTLNWITADISAFALIKPYVLLVPGSAPQHPGKRWPAENYAKLAQELLQRGYQPVILGTDAEKKAAHLISKNAPGVLNLCGQTSLPHIVALARGAAGAIGNDTGPMHLIAATSCSTLALFSGHSNSIKHAPRGTHVAILQEQNLADLKVEKVLSAFAPREL